MTFTRIDIDEGQVREALSYFEFVGGNADKALSVAINKAGPKIRTRASQAIRADVRLKARYVNERLRFDRSTRRRLSGRISAPDRGLLLSRFLTDSRMADPNKASWLKPPEIPARGLRVKVKPTGPTKTVGSPEGLSRPFLMVLPSSRRLAIVARRKNTGGIEVFHGPSLSQVFDSERKDLEPAASEELTRQMLDAMRFLLAKKFPKE